MSAAQFVVGVDGGTESLRAGVFDLAGQLVGTCSSPYATQFPQPGWAEQIPDDWWQALGVAVKGALKASGVQAIQIAAFGLDTTCCTVVALGSDDQPLRPALMWMDQRSASQAAEVAASGDIAVQVNSAGLGPVSAEWMVPKSLWLKQNEPHLFEQATTICEYQDYINLRLTGRMCGSVNNASVRWHYSTQRGIPLSLMQKLGIPELAAKWPQVLLPLGAPVGGLTEAAAQHLGLLPGTLVAQGGADSFIGMLGLGVVRPGQMALLTGSSHLQLGMVATEMHFQGIFGTYSDAVLPGVHVIEGGQTSTGSIVNWFKRTLVPPEVTYDTLNEEAAAVPPGCEGLSCLDHFQGNRTPHTDPLSRGALVGLTLRHGRGHVYRSLMESVAYGTRLILDTMTKNGYLPESIAIAGGAARSPLWLQMHADVCNVPFVLTKEIEAPMLGSAILAAYAAQLFPDIPAAVEAMVGVDSVIQPDLQAHELYNRHYAAYVGLYPALKQTFHSQAAVARADQKGQPSAAAPDLDAGPGSGATAASQDLAPTPRGILSASILAADFSRLGSDVDAALTAGADWIHVDMFDGTYVDNFTIGPPVLKALRACHPHAFFDCHLAVKDPSRYLAEVAAAGASQFTFHAEVLDCNLIAMTALASQVRAKGMRAGVALAPDTPASAVMPLLEAGSVDLVLCMTVTPGFGGQQMIPEVLQKVQQLRQAFPTLDIQVDGGINAKTAPLAVQAGANVLVAGSAVFTAASLLPMKAAMGSRDQEALRLAVAAIKAPLRA